MVGTRTVTGGKATASVGFEPVERLVSRLRAGTARRDADEVAELARTDTCSLTLDADPRKQHLERYRELTASPVRWVRLT